jgi:hypothetical protein
MKNNSKSYVGYKYKNSAAFALISSRIIASALIQPNNNAFTTSFNFLGDFNK